MKEEIMIVNERDEIQGYCSKEEAHRKGILHRAFSVFIVSDSQMLIQRRALEKYHSGGLWANACCSHPRRGESLEVAVERRLLEELGIRNLEVKELFSFIYRHEFRKDLFEHEYDHVFLGEYYGAVEPNPEEIAEVKWMELKDLKRALKEKPELFACWFQIAAPRILEFLGV